MVDQTLEDRQTNQKLILDNSVEPATQRQKLAWERELIGIYISEHPLDIYKNILQSKTVDLNELNSLGENLQLSIGGLITTIREISTKNNQKMAFAKLEDFSSEVELIFFPQVFAKYRKILDRDRIYILKGKIADRSKDSINPGEPKFLVSSMEEISDEEALNFKPEKVTPKASQDCPE